MDLLTFLGGSETHLPLVAILSRLLIAAVLGGAIGFERATQAGAAGVRTHMLVSLAAALFTVLAFELFARAREGGSQNPDPIRAIEAVTAGIAFLGAGAIFHTRGSVQGLTTGAGMWLAGAIGVTAGIGLYALAGLVALFAIVVLSLLRRWSHHLPKGEQ